MSKLDWGIGISAGLIVLAILAGGTYGLFEYHHNNNERYQEVANQKVGEPPSYICGVLPSPLRLSCSPIATNSADDSDKAVNYDLNAQQDMAFAAFGVLFASVASVLLSIAAIYFVIRTLNATRQTNLITRDMGERQIRAYLGAGEVKGVNVAAGLAPSFTLKITNSGASPAHKCKVLANVFRCLDSSFKRNG